MLQQKKEKLILFISFISGLIFALVELGYSIMSHSHSVMADAFYDSTELIFIALILFLTPLFYKPISEDHPYGYFQIESIFIIIKGFMMMSLTLSIGMEVIESFIEGGHHVNDLNISVFQAVLGTISYVIYIIIKRLNKKISSPTIDAEILGWKIDYIYSFGMAAAFFGAMLLKKTPLDFLSPYVDPIVAILVMAITLPENIKLMWGAIKDLFLFPPDEEIVNEIKEICNAILEKKNYTSVFFDVTKTGRHIWISVYFKIPYDALPISDLKELRDEVNKKIHSNFENCTCDLILMP